MQHIAIVIACIFFCYGCDPAPGIFLANRSGNDKIIYITGGNYNLLKDGYEITYRPLRSSFFNDEKLYIGNTINDLLLPVRNSLVSSTVAAGGNLSPLAGVPGLTPDTPILP